MKKKQTIIDLNDTEARAFLLRDECYSNILLPKYYKMNRAVKHAETIYIQEKAKAPNCFSIKKIGDPRQGGNVNYTIIANKDGKYAWRPLTFINPILYIDFVYTITDAKYWNEICTLLSKRINKIGDRIMNVGMPVVTQNNMFSQKEQILEWWQSVEQKSLEKSLEYECICQTDITNFYGSIYTHTLEWAFSGYSNSKNGKYNNSCVGIRGILASESKVSLTSVATHDSVGVIIDKMLMGMSFGETNGIPQGSVLMDFVAEILLSYADEILYEEIKQESIQDYYIIRYRDDYRVFVNSKRDGEVILKKLAEIMLFLHLKLNPSKTFASYDVVQNSIKRDKMALITSALCDRLGSGISITFLFNDYINPQRILLQIYDFSKNYENSGQLKRLLSIFDDIVEEICRCEEITRNDFKYRCQKLYRDIVIWAREQGDYSKAFRDLLKSSWQILKQGNSHVSLNISHKLSALVSIKTNASVLMALLVNIAYGSPSTFPIVAGIISKLILCFDPQERLELCTKIRAKFSNMPNCEFIDIWLQRITCKIAPSIPYDALICQSIYNAQVKLWNYSWVTDPALRSQLENVSIVDMNEIQNMPNVISQYEYNIFLMDDYYPN